MNPIVIRKGIYSVTVSVIGSRYQVAPSFSGHWRTYAKLTTALNKANELITSR